MQALLSFIGRIFNFIFTTVAVLLGPWLVGYGIWFSVRKDPDTGVFLVLLGLLLVGSVGWGLVTARVRARRKAARAPAPQPPVKAAVKGKRKRK